MYVCISAYIPTWTVHVHVHIGCSTGLSRLLMSEVKPVGSAMYSTKKALIRCAALELTVSDGDGAGVPLPLPRLVVAAAAVASGSRAETIEGAL